MMSGYRDSNPGPPTPEAGALTGLRYIPNIGHIRLISVYEKRSYCYDLYRCRDTRIRTWDPLLPKQVR